MCDFFFPPKHQEAHFQVQTQHAEHTLVVQNKRGCGTNTSDAHVDALLGEPLSEKEVLYGIQKTFHSQGLQNVLSYQISSTEHSAESSPSFYISLVE